MTHKQTQESVFNAKEQGDAVDTTSKARHKAGVMDALEGYLRGRGRQNPGRGKGKRKNTKAPRPLKRGFAPQRLLACIIIYVLVTTLVLRSELA